MKKQFSELDQNTQAEIYNLLKYKEQWLQRQEHEVSELICLGCKKRWIGVYPSKSLLKNAECECGAIGLIIKTGQTMFDAIINL